MFTFTVEKMKMIDKEYEDINHSGDKFFSLQSKLAAYRKDVDTQTQAEINIKVLYLVKNIYKINLFSVYDFKIVGAGVQLSVFYKYG